MEERIYDYWVATLQDGYIGNIIALTDAAGGAKSLYGLFARQNQGSSIDRILNGFVDDNGKVMFTKNMRKHIEERWKNLEILKKEYYRMMDNGICYVNHADRDFPAKLLNIPSPPYGLFVKGSLPDENIPSVAIVGARECTEYGRVCAEYFGDRLARENVQIISGMAWGIDGIAQMSAVRAGGKSFGVLGCGPDVVYPRKNYRLYEMLCERGNGIISEYAPGMQAQSRMFPPRNRIISGLCDVLIVVEARAKSGTLITVNMAVEQGKNVMAVPGRITDDLSHGCLHLIREGASPAISIESVLDELGSPREEYVRLKLNPESGRETGRSVTGRSETAGRGIGESGIDEVELNNDEKKIWNCLSLDPQNAEDIVQISGMNISEVLINLSKMDIKGIIREVAPGEYVKNI